jgi:hypothetical protein
MIVSSSSILGAMDVQTVVDDVVVWEGDLCAWATGVAEQKLHPSVLVVEPNPTEGICSVRVPGQPSPDLLLVTDQEGRRVRAIPPALGAAGQELDLSGLSPGLYIITWYGAGTIYQGRVIVL